MADVIPFAPPRRRPTVTAVAGEPTGQILFFTGVRYEREPETVPVAAKRVRRPRRAGNSDAGRRRPG